MFDNEVRWTCKLIELGLKNILQVTKKNGVDVAFNIKNLS